MHWTTENCPYGNASDYTELVWTNFTPSVPIEYALQEFAFEQLQTLIAASLGVNLEATLQNMAYLLNCIDAYIKQKGIMFLRVWG